MAAENPFQGFSNSKQLKMESKKDVLRTSAAEEEDDDDNDDCIILEGDPFAPTLIDNNLNQPESDDLIVVREKGEVACRDYPHPRHLCAAFPFASTSHFEHCRQCHCYVCDSLAPCASWGTGTYVTDHCHATDKEQTWKVKRNCHRLYGGNAHTPISPSPINCPAQTFQTQSTGDGDSQALNDRAEISRIINRLYGGNASTPIPQSPINCPAQTFQTQPTGDGDRRQALYDRAQISRAIRKKLSRCSREEEGFARIDFATNRQDSLSGYCNGAQPCNDPQCSLPYNSRESQNYHTTDKEQTWKVERHHKYGGNASTPIPQSPVNRRAQTYQKQSSGIGFATNPQDSLPDYSNGAQCLDDPPSCLPYRSYESPDYTNPAYTMHHYSYGYQDYTDPQYSKAHYSNVSQGCTNPLSSVPYQNYGFQGYNNSPYSSRYDASYYGSEDYISPPYYLQNGTQGYTNSRFRPPDYSYESQGYTNPTCSLPNYSYRSPDYTNYRC